MGLSKGATSRGWVISEAKTLGTDEVLEHMPGGSSGFVIVERTSGSGGFAIANQSLTKDLGPESPASGSSVEAGLEKRDQRPLYFTELNLLDLHRFNARWVSKAARGTRLSTSTCSCKAWGPSPSGPRPSRVGIPRAAVKQPSLAPPVEPSCRSMPSSAASPACLLEQLNHLPIAVPGAAA